MGLSSSQVGLVGSLFFLAFTIGGFGAGLINRWMSLRWALVVLALCWALAMLPVVVSATFAVLVISRMFLGLAEGPSSALVHTAAYSWHPVAKRGLPGALLAGAASISKIAIAPVLAVVTVTYGWRAALVSLTIAGVLWCVIWLAAWKEGPYLGGKNAKTTAQTDTADTTDESVPYLRIFTTRTFISATFLVMSVYALVTVVLTWLPSYFEVGLGYSRLQAGSMFAFPSIAGLILMVASTFIGDRLIARGATSRTIRVVVPAVGVLVCGAVLFLLPSISTPAIAVLAVSVGYGFATSVFPMFNAAISEICPPRQTGRHAGRVPRADGSRRPDRAVCHGRDCRRRRHPGRRLRHRVPDSRRRRRGRRSRER